MLSSTTKRKSEILVEIKGYFQEASEASKYLWVRKSLKEDQELVFVFERPQTEFHWLKRRKDGTRQTMAEWADKHEFRWFTLESFMEYFNAQDKGLQGVGEHEAALQQPE